MVPLVYTVSYNGETYGPRNSTLTDDGNYEGDFKELNMCFAPITDNISVTKYSSTIGFMDDIAEGVYDVTVTAPTASGNVERSFKLIVGDEPPTATPTAEPTATPTPDADNGENTEDTPTAAPTPDAEPTVTPEVTPTTAPGENTDDSENPENPETPAEDPTVTPAPDDTAKDDPAADDTNQDNQNGTGKDASSDQWKQDENLDDLVKDEIQKENETVKNFDEISNPSGTDSTEDGYLISDVSLLIQPMAVSLSGSVVSEEQTETAEAETADEGEHELLAAAEQKSNLSAGEMTASAADDVSTLRAAGTILVGPDNYGTNKTSTPTPTATPSKSSSNNSSSNSNTGSTKIPQKKTQTTASIRSIPVNTGDETMVLPLAISSALSAAVMFCMAFLQMQAKRAKSMAAWLEFKKNHPFDEK